MTATNPEQPGPKFAEFLSLVRALPTDHRAAFDQLVANVRTGIAMREAGRQHLTDIGCSDDEIQARLDDPGG